MTERQHNSIYTDCKFSLWLLWRGMIDRDESCIYDRPNCPRRVEAIFRVPWIRRKEDPSYAEPMLLHENGVMKTNPRWDRDKAIPVCR